MNFTPTQMGLLRLEAMLKLYKITDAEGLYWETWQNGAVHTVHWGKLGERGESKEVTPESLGRKPEEAIQEEIHAKVQEGYRPVAPEEHAVMLIEYAIEGMGTNDDLEKRHRLEERMDETLGWTGLGHCDGGSIGSGTMEACCLVVDFDRAKAAVEADLKGTEFGDYSRIFKE